MVNVDQFLWVEKYRPKTIDDCILPERFKEIFKSQVKKGELQNMLLVGSPGTGKTTVARALCNELGIDTLLINASENGNLDTLRTTIRSFASTVSFLGKFKCVILDEADYLTSFTQPALRGFIEEFSSNCRFILTANYKNKIIPAIQSRCAVIDFSFTKEEKEQLIVKFDKRIRSILELEGINYDRKNLAQLIIKFFPDFRKTLNELQKLTQSGMLSGASIILMSEDNIKKLVQFLKEKNFREVRKWVIENLDNDFTSIQRALYERMYEYIEPQSIPQLILILAQYDYKNAFVVDKEVNILAMFVEIMAEVKFK